MWGVIRGVVREGFRGGFGKCLEGRILWERLAIYHFTIYCLRTTTTTTSTPTTTSTTTVGVIMNSSVLCV